MQPAGGATQPPTHRLETCPLPPPKAPAPGKAGECLSPFSFGGYPETPGTPGTNPKNARNPLSSLGFSVPGGTGNKRKSTGNTGNNLMQGSAKRCGDCVAGRSGGAAGALWPFRRGFAAWVFVPPCLGADRLVHIPPKVGEQGASPWDSSAKGSSAIAAHRRPRLPGRASPTGQVKAGQAFTSGVNW